ncbi:hypothetical protein O181_054687 [Austropuccinia psidii MF-1]|uniref:Retrotransposon gag domain-containing protein n=1 Tax=Austropuccinia psidii MF-1 TaxID=1389203 RepID=A0A9Q3E7E1_9BASI|nr:hypothetical protein [Austropuccinia psidii MF-1]
MPIQHSLPARQTRSQARTQAALTTTPRAPLDGTPEDFQGPGEDGEEEEENSVEEEESDGTEGVPAAVGASQGTGGPSLAQSDQPVSHQSEPSLLAIMQKMTEIMANFQAASVSGSSRPPAFKTPSMKAPEFFDDPDYLLNSWSLFKSQLFTLFGDPNEVRKAEAELDSPRMKEGGHVSLYIANFRSLVSITGDWGERALIHHFRKGLPYRILDQLASHPSIIDSLQGLMDVTLELDTRYHDRQKEKSHNQEKTPEASKSNSSHPQNSSSSSQRKRKNFQKRDKPHSSLMNKDLMLMSS